MNSFWDPPTFAGHKRCLYFYFHLNQQRALAVNPLTSSASFHAGSGAGPALECASWVGSSGTASGAALPAGSSAHRLAVALGNNGAHSRGELAELGVFSLKSPVFPALDRDEPRRGCGSSEHPCAAAVAVLHGEGQAQTLSNSLHQCSTDSTDTVEARHTQALSNTSTDTVQILYRYCSCRYALCYMEQACFKKSWLWLSQKEL